MTDKQIIIDGIDVSGCNFTLERDGKIKCECTHATGFGVICNCESWKTCDYKNYKRKEQECEELKNIINEAKNSKLDLKSFLVGEAIQNEYEQQLDQLKTEKEEFKQTLIEIQQELEFATYCESQECGCDDPNECFECTTKQILQKISECEVENDT